jgi:hypothetical protein
MLWALPLLFAFANAAKLTSYFDSECKTPLIDTVAFTDVCTWSSNRYSGSYAIHLSSCSETSVDVNLFNLTGQAGCNGVPDYTFTANTSCVPYKDAYVKVNDFTCASQNSTYNILAHFTPGCQDGGYAFSIDLGQPSCQGASFGPGLWNLDAEGSYSDPYYQLELFNSTDGTCQDQLATFQTKQFPAECLPTVQPFQNISIDIYPAFPLP